MNILIMSDVMPPERYDRIYAEGRLEELLSAELIREIEAADYNILNLECPLTTCEDRLDKWGLCVKADPENIGILKHIPNLVVNLANNHIRDYGSDGVLDTIRTLEQNGIPYVGAGSSEQDMKRYHVLEMDGERVAIYSCCEHDSSAACGEQAGANGCQEGDDILLLQQLRDTYDRVILLYHGGREFYPYPTPNEQRRLRNDVRAGADLIVCQHNHCVSATERYLDGTIIYGQGNYLVDHRPEIENNIQDHDMWNRGMMVSYDTVTNQCDYVPYVREEHGIWQEDTAGNVLEQFRLLSQQIVEPGFVASSWREYCDWNLHYLRIFKGGLDHQEMDMRSRVREMRDALCLDEDRQHQILLQINNYLNCESHQELVMDLCRRLMER